MPVEVRYIPGTREWVTVVDSVDEGVGFVALVPYSPSFLKTMDLEDETWPGDRTNQFYEVSRKTLASWARRGFAKDGKGKYSVLACFRWWKKFVIGQVDGQATDLTTERLLRERAKGKLDELKAEKEAGRLIEREQAYRWLTEILAEALASETDSRVIEEILMEEVRRRILTDMSQGKGRRP